MPPQTRYAKNGGASIAYQVFGDGPIDLVLVPGFVSNVEHYWEMPVVPRMLQRLGSFARVIIFDKRGTGLSDPVAAVPTVEERMEDLRAVMDAAGSERAALFGISEGGPMSLVFAATYPQRASAVALYGTSPKFCQDEDWEAGWPPGYVEGMLEAFERGWGEGVGLGEFAPSVADDPGTLEVWGRYQRAGASPSMAAAVMKALAALDVRAILPSVRVPVTIIHRVGDRIAHIDAARYMAQVIPGARLVELPGDDHHPFVGDWEPIVEEVEEFLTGVRHAGEPDRVLATVLFTDIVGSTERASQLGDRRWRELLEGHDTAVRRELGRYRGREVKTTGDGFLATFDGPARGIECASAIHDATRSLGVPVRAGMHTGECELIGDDIGGMAVHIGARIGAQAEAGQTLVSSTVKELVVGSPLRFSELGSRELKGVPGEWHLFAVEP